MWDVLEILLGLAFDVVGAVFSWRFYVSLLPTLALVAGIFWLLPNPTAAAVVAVPVGVVGLILGFVWDRNG
jgi:hypothetical protein